MPGMLVYFVDLVFRAGQCTNVTTLTAADIKPGGNVVTLQLKVDQVSTALHCTALPALAGWQAVLGTASTHCSPSCAPLHWQQAQEATLLSSSSCAPHSYGPAEDRGPGGPPARVLHQPANSVPLAGTWSLGACSARPARLAKFFPLVGNG